MFCTHVEFCVDRGAEPSTKSQSLLDTKTLVCRLWIMCRTTVGYLVLTSTNLVLEKDLDIVGDLECDGNCPTKTKESFYDFEKDQMCPAGFEDGAACAASVCTSYELLATRADSFASLEHILQRAARTGRHGPRKSLACSATPQTGKRRKLPRKMM